MQYNKLTIRDTSAFSARGTTSTLEPQLTTRYTPELPFPLEIYL